MAQIKSVTKRKQTIYFVEYLGHSADITFAAGDVHWAYYQQSVAGKTYGGVVVAPSATELNAAIPYGSKAGATLVASGILPR